MLSARTGTMTKHMTRRTCFLIFRDPVLSPSGRTIFRRSLRTFEDLGNRRPLPKIEPVIERHPRPVGFEEEALGAQQRHGPFDVPAQAFAPLPLEPSLACLGLGEPKVW